ncbi:MAG: hypothetical protein RLZZ437_1757 [Pseudomonadota bacterium]|jgi:Cu2+-exporting ATPase
MTALPASMGCAACAVAPLATWQAAEAAGAGTRRVLLTLPGAHCAACIGKVEAALLGVPGVRAARVNLTQKRAYVDAAAQVTVDALCTAIAAAGYEVHELHEASLLNAETVRQGRDLLMRLGVAFFAMMNVMLLSVAVWSGASDATRDMFHWISASIALPTVLFSGQPFFRSALASLRAGKLGMDVPISLALILASGISLFETANSGHHAFFDAAVMLCFFLLAGRYLDHRTRALARSAAAELAALEVPRATVLRGGVAMVVPIAEVGVGDAVQVLPGARVPVDGVVTEGASEVDRSLLTGEALPARVLVGTALCVGEVNLTGPLTLRVTGVGTGTTLHRMAELVAVAEAAKGRARSLADRAAAWYSPLVHILSFSAFGVWMWQTGGDLRTSINISAAVLIITCPCALGLAVPAVVTAASGHLFRKGLLVKNGTALERLAEVDTVVFDKTGTLTLGKPVLQGALSLPNDHARVALALAMGTAHPLATALAESLRAAGLQPAPVEALREVPGDGVTGLWKGQPVRLGRADWVDAPPIESTATYLRLGEVTHAFAFGDTLRPGAQDLIASLHRAGMAVVIMSGDTAPAVRAMADRLGIADWHAGMRPETKASMVAGLAAQGRRVLMVGDGLNDTTALASAHVSISPANALDAARAASDIVLLGQDLGPVAEALRIARRARSRIIENFAISAGYNVVAVPLALVGLATPLAAALAMSLSSITVSLNALRVK